MSNTHPEVAAEWHPTANGEVSLKDISAGSQFRATWLCKNNHQLIQRVDHRVRRGGCRVCFQEQFLAHNSLAAKFPDIAKQWDASRNGDLTPDMVAAGSELKVWWRCDKVPSHMWSALIFNRTGPSAQGCPLCAGRQVDETNSLAARCPEIAKQWHPTLNGELTPDQVTWASHKRAVWLCEKNHTWTQPVCARTSDLVNCPKCNGKYLTDENRLNLRFPEIAAEWHPTKNRMFWLQTGGNWTPYPNLHLAPEDRELKKNRRLLPSDVSYGSNEEAWWQCSKNPEHEPWRAKVFVRTMQGWGCPTCSGRKITSANSLEGRYPAVAKLWHPSRNLPLTPQQVTYGSEKVAWWRCFKYADHLYEARIRDVVKSHNNGKASCIECRKLKQGKVKGERPRKSG